MYLVAYTRLDEDELFGPFVDDNAVKQFTSELGGDPKIWVDSKSKVGLAYEGGEWRVKNAYL